MTAAKRVGRSKSEVVFFRLSPDEFEAVQHASISSGAKSMSAFARFAILSFLEGYTSGADPVEDLQLLGAKLADFELAFRCFVQKQKDQKGNESVSE